VNRLQAKSWNYGLGSPPDSIYLPSHLRDVVNCSIAISASTQDFQLQAFGVDPDKLRQRFTKLLNVAAACHDLGKANNHFQQIVIGTPSKNGLPTRQAVRHEWISWYLLQQDDMSSWIKSCFDCSTSEVDWHIVLWAITGHHPAYGREIPRSQSQGSSDAIELYLSHPDYLECLDVVAKCLGQSSCPIRPKSRTVSANEDVLVAIRDWPSTSTICWRTWQRDPVIVALVAAVKNSLVAADVAASALPTQSDTSMRPELWHTMISDCLLNVPSSGQLDELIQDRLTAQGKRHSLRPFQRDVAARASDVTLVKAGCGSGKTLAAYHWAQVRCSGKRLYVCYPTTGTTTEGFRDYVFDKDEHQPKYGAKLFHGRASIDRRIILETPNDESVDDDTIARIRSLQSWNAPIVTCTVDTVLGIIHNQRRAIYSWPSICNAAFVFDEIHSYDSSMFGSLLAFLQKLKGVPVLLMTASLPLERLERLRKVIRDRGGELQEIDGPKELEGLKRYRHESIDVSDIPDRVKEELANNGKVLWVSNTVDRTIRAYQNCSSFCDSATVYHSRFRYVDRVKRHKAVINAFANNDAAIAWTSQVAEMSLDLSATLLITELAPISALIQRLGRLNRRATSPIDPIRPFIVIEPVNETGEFAPLPYKREQLNEAIEWLATLPETISQEDLVAQWESMPASEREQIDVNSTWIDGGFDRVVKELREGSPGVTVIRREDRDRVIQGESMLVEVTIPMNQRFGAYLSDWPRFQGAFVVDDTQIDYSELLGGKWI
jgi:CRISPR-associated endonuclease/helicase Cas3